MYTDILEDNAFWKRMSHRTLCVSESKAVSSQEAALTMIKEMNVQI